MFSGLVYNSPKSPTVPSKVKKLENKGNNLRFQGLSLQEKTQQRAEAIEKMKIGVCACKFEDSITPTKVMGEAERGMCAPKTAICGFCMNAAYVSYWHPNQDSCAQYIGEAKQVCDAVAGGAGKAAEDLEHLYKTYGPQFGATAVWCKKIWVVVTQSNLLYILIFNPCKIQKRKHAFKRLLSDQLLYPKEPKEYCTLLHIYVLQFYTLKRKR